MSTRAASRLGVFVVMACACAAACEAAPGEPLRAPCAGETDERLCSARTVDVNGVSRDYIVSHQTPEDCDRGRLPVVIAWHGSDGNGQELRDYLDVEPAFLGEMAFVYPDGLPRDDNGGRRGWNREPDGDDVLFFDALLGALAEDPCLDVDRLFSVGHSRGGRFVEVLGCVRGHKHRAMASIAAGSGNVDSLTCTGSAPVWLTHGVNDEEVWFFEGELVRDAWAKRNGCDDVGWFSDFPLNECTPLDGCDRETVFCPSDVEEWRGHFPPPFVGDGLRWFFRRHF